MAEIARRLDAIKAEVGKTGEVKWKNAKSYNGRAHTAYVDYLFELIAEKKAQFHIRFSEMADYDHRLSGERRKVDTISKAFYQLLLHRPCRYYHNLSVFIHPDDGEYTALLPDQIGALNHQCRQRFGGQEDGCVKVIEPRSSEREQMLQLLDVPLGALAALRNGRTLPEAYSPIKRALANHVLAHTGWPNVLGNTEITHASVNKWNARPNR